MPSRPPPSAAPRAEPPQAARVLLVDDEAGYARFLRETLIRHPAVSIALTHVGRLADAEPLLDAEDNWHLVLLDLTLPDGSSIEWLTRHKQTRELPPVVVLTEACDESTAMAALRAGAQDCLSKAESDLDLLVRVIRYAIERYRVREQLKRTGERFRDLIENALDIIMTVDPGGVILYTSPSTRRVLGLAPEDIVGRTLWDFMEPGEVEVGRTLLREIFEQPGASRTSVVRVRHADGTWHAIEVIGQRLRSGSRDQAALNARDVTERLRAASALRDREEQLRQAQKMEAIGRLAGGIAHDFTNLLTVIIGASEQLIDRLPVGDPLHREVESIRRSAERAAAMTRQLLAFSRQQVLAPVVLNLNDVVSGMDRLLRRLIGEDIEFLTRGVADLGLVRADRNQIERVLLNLAINARDAMPSGGRLIIETRNVDIDESQELDGTAIKPGRYVVVEVSDTGVGMDADTHARAFEPFFTTKESDKGTGLGLATVYGVVTQSGGAVTLKTAPVRGTTVEVYLPRVAGSTSAVPPAQEGPPPPGQGETVLLVEDEETVRELVRDVLEAAGYVVFDADRPHVAEQICIARPDRIDLLLSDVVMPEMNGHELAERLVQIRPAMKVLFMSGYTEHAVVHGGALKTGRPFLAKPFSRSTLLKKVRDVLDGRSGH